MWIMDKCVGTFRSDNLLCMLIKPHPVALYAKYGNFAVSETGKEMAWGKLVNARQALDRSALLHATRILIDM